MSFGNVLDQYFNKARGILHIGAHHGYEYFGYKEKNIQNIIFFEPLSENFRILSQTVGKECFLYNLAIGNDNCEIEMFVEEANQSSSSSILEPKLMSEVYPHIIFNKKEKVQMKKLDDVNFNRFNYNLMIVDTQGYELEVFKGATETLKHIDYIVTEVNFEELYKNCALHHELTKFLVDNNFALCYTMTYAKSWGDSLYIKKHLL